MKKFVSVSILVILVLGCESDGPSYGTKTRPKDFPNFMKPLSDSDLVVYSSPENGETVEGTYALTSHVTEEYPPEKTMVAVQEQLSSAGFIRAKYLLYATQKLEVDYSWQTKNIHNETYLAWAEHWIHKDKDEAAGVSFSYRYKANTKSSLVVTITHFTVRAEFSALVKKYKNRYPQDDWEKPANQIDFHRIK